MSPEPSHADRPEVTIVIGSRRTERRPDACLEALRPQVGPGVEVILVEDRAVSPAPPAWVRAEVRPGGLVPELWAEGIRHAGGSVIALTTTAVVPDPDWVERMRGAHGDGLAVVGGAIEPGANMSMVDWAAYFCRYSAYMRPFAATAGLEVAADNASYDAGRLAPYRDIFRDAFWEPFVHRPMRRDGLRLEVRPDIVVRQASGATVGAFSRQRFLHGRVHGRMRSSGLTRAAVALRAVSAPLVPALMTLRVIRNMATRRRYAGRLIASLPLIVWFYSCWAAGELVGRLQFVAGKETT